MRILPEKLETHLNHQLHAAYLIIGNDPLLQLEAKDRIHHHAKQAGFLEKHLFVMDNQLNWNTVFDCCQSLSLFSSRQIIELIVPESGLSASSTQQLIALSTHLHSDILLIVSSDKTFSQAQERLKWVKTYQTLGPLINCNTPDAPRLLKMIQERCHKLKLSPDPESIQLLAQWYEGNLVALVQSLEKLTLIYPDGQLTLPRLESALNRHNHYTPFQWVDALLAGQTKRAQTILRQLQQENIEANILLRTIQRELFLLLTLQQDHERGTPLFQLFEQHKIWRNKHPLYSNILQRLSLKDIHAAINLLAQIEVQTKTTYEYDTWSSLSHLSILLSSSNQYTQTT